MLFVCAFYVPNTLKIPQKYHFDQVFSQHLPNAKIQIRIFFDFFEKKKYQFFFRKINKKCKKLVFAMNTPHRLPQCILVFCLIAF